MALEVAIVGRLNNRAIVDETGALKVTSTGGGGGGITQAQAQAAFEAALDSRDVTQGQYRTPTLVRLTGGSTTTITVDCYSFSVANVGSQNVTIYIGMGSFILKSSEVVNLEAGAANNVFVANSISVNPGTSEAILSYIS